MKKMLLMALLALAALAAWAVMDLEAEISGYRGSVFLKDGKAWLHEQYGDDLRLLLAPRAVLDTLGLVLAEGDSIYVEGIRDKDLFLVGKLWKESEGGNLYWLRQIDYGSLDTGGEASYKVDTQKCISCRLCVAPCPTGAITMIKGKAQIDPAKCTECGICIDGHAKFKGCPVGAIAPR